MLNRLTVQLESPDPAERKAAIKALAQTTTEDPQRVLRLLALVYQQDPDPDVRYLALQAGRYVKKFIPETVKMPERTRLSDFRDATQDAAAPARTSLVVSAAAETRAKGLVTEAFNCHMRGENRKAVTQLRAAFKANPNLTANSYATGLATTLTGLPGPEAVAAILGKSRVATTQGSSLERLRTVGESSRDDAGWARAGMWVGIMTAVLTLVPLVIILLFVELFAALAGVRSSSVSGQFVELFTPPFLVSALLTVAGLCLQLLFTHGFARLLFKGQGTLPALIHKIVRFYTIYYAATIGIIVLGFIVLLILAIFAPRIAISLAELLDTFGLMLAAAIFLIQVIWTFKLVTDNYLNFDILRGIASALLGYGVMIGLLVLSLLAFPNWLEDLFENMVRAFS